MTCELLRDRRDREAWEALLREDPDASVYHSPSWIGVLTGTYGYEPRHLGCRSSDGSLRSLLPLLLVKSRLTGRRLVSLPFSNACGPLGDSRMFPELLGTAREIADRERCDALEIRMRDDAAVFEDERFHRLDAFVTSVVPLDPDPEKVWSAFRDRHCRREVRQAGRKGLQARQGGAADLAPFHRLLQLTKKKHGVPVQPFSFFRNLWNEFHPRDMIRIFVAELEGRPVSSLITLRQGEKQYAAYMGTDGRFMSYRPNSLLLWTAMEWGCRAGCRSFDFLRSERADERLRYFKSRWRAEEVGLSYYYYPEIKGTAATVERSLKYRLLTGLLRRSPTFVSRAVGRLLYPHLG